MGLQIDRTSIRLNMSRWSFYTPSAESPTQALSNSKTSAALNEWLENRLNEKLSAFDQRWAERYEQMDAKWQRELEKRESEWHSLLHQMNTRVESKLELVDFLKDQNRLQMQLVAKLQGQLEAKHDELVHTLVAAANCHIKKDE